MRVGFYRDHGIGGLLLGLPLALGMNVADAGETRRVDGLEFTQVIVVGSAEIEISQGPECALQLQGDPADLDREPFYIKGDGLIVGKSRSSRSGAGSDLRFRAILPSLEKVRVNGSGAAYVKPFTMDRTSDVESTSFIVEGSGDIKLYGFDGGSAELRVKGNGDIRAAELRVDDLEAVVAGNGDLYIGSVQAESGEFVITGSGDLRVTEGGFVEQLEVNVVGSGDADLPDVASTRAEVNIVGSGSIDIGEVSDQLNASVLGSGDVRYRGEPNVDKVELGSGEVRR